MRIDKYIDNDGGDLITNTFFLVRDDEYLYNKSILFNLVETELKEFIKSNIRFDDNEVDMRMEDEQGNLSNDKMLICRRELDLTPYNVYYHPHSIPYNKYSNEKYVMEITIKTIPADYGDGATEE
jgi:hypothetical protein